MQKGMIMIKESYINKKTAGEVLIMYETFEAFGHQANDYLSPTFVENGVIYSVKAGDPYDYYEGHGSC